MIPQRFNVGRMRGISIEIDRSCFVLFFLLTAFFATQFSGRSPHLNWTRELTLGSFASVAFLCSLFLHELGHTLVALRYGLPVRSIRFFSFGGFTDIGKKPESATQEWLIAISGPVVSTIIGGVLIATSRLWPSSSSWEWIVLARLLGRINLLLALFNLLPVFPLDGGRALRATFWKRSGNYERATRQVQKYARLFVYGLMIAGTACLFFYSVFAGLLTALIAWRLHSMLTEHVGVFSHR